jgi:hypothetical protein
VAIGSAAGRHAGNNAAHALLTAALQPAAAGLPCCPSAARTPRRGTGRLHMLSQGQVTPRQPAPSGCQAAVLPSPSTALARRSRGQSRRLGTQCRTHGHSCVGWGTCVLAVEAVSAGGQGGLGWAEGRPRGSAPPPRPPPRKASKQPTNHTHAQQPCGCSCCPAALQPAAAGLPCCPGAAWGATRGCRAARVGGGGAESRARGRRGRLPASDNLQGAGRCPGTVTRSYCWPCCC